MTEVAQGTSLARFGHGELLIMWGENAEHQKYDRRLDIELGQIVGRSPCLVAAPPNDPPEWRGFLKKYGAPIRNERWYGSSFVSRHDWAPWTEEYRRTIQGLWKDRFVFLVAPERIELNGAGAVLPILSPKRNAFAAIDELESAVLCEEQHCAGEQLIILSCGPTATVLADRLARKGIWAVDLGNFGKFL